MKTRGYESMNHFGQNFHFFFIGYYFLELFGWNLREDKVANLHKGSLTLAMGKCLWFSVKIKVCQSSFSSP